jgi:hypothetical protein
LDLLLIFHLHNIISSYPNPNEVYRQSRRWVRRQNRKRPNQPTRGRRQCRVEFISVFF